MKLSHHIKTIYFPIHILAIIAIISLFFVSKWWLLVVLFGYIMWGGLGISIGHHRLFAHKSFQTYRWVEIILLFLGIFGGEGSSISWIAIHSGLHHPFSDTAKDIHSPVNGKWNAFGMWMHKVTEKTVSLRYAGKLLRDPYHVFVHKNYTKIFWIPIAITAILNWHIALFFFVLPTFLSIYKENFVNLFCHQETHFSYKNLPAKDNSTNNWLLGYITFGDAWHNNHHSKPAEYDFGLGQKYHWWEFDPCVPIIWLLKKR